MFILKTYGITDKNILNEASESESCSAVSNSVTTWTIQSMEFSRPEYWSG